MTTGSRTEGIRGIGSEGFIRTVKNLTVTGDLVVHGETRSTVGTGVDVSAYWETADANANYWAFDLPSGGSVSVPVVGFGIGLTDVDLGLFDGITQTTLAVLDSDRDSFIALDFSADDAARLRSNTTINISPTGALSVGTDGSGNNVVFYSATSGDNLTWDSGDEVLQITGTNGQTSLDVLDGDVRVVDTLYFYDRGGESMSSDGSTLTVAGTVVFSGNITVNGTTTTVSSTTVVIDDPLFHLGNDNNADAVDLGIFAEYTDSGKKFSGLFRDASDSDKWKLFATTGNSHEEPSTTVNTTSGFTLANLAVNELEGTLATAAQGNVTSLGTLTALQVDFINANASTLTITDSSDTGDTFSIATTTHGATTITTVDDDAAAAHLTLTIDGDVIVNANVLPGTDDTYDLGSASAAWQDLFLEGDITMTDAGTIQASAGGLTVSANSGTWTFGTSSTDQAVHGGTFTSTNDGATARLTGTRMTTNITTQDGSDTITTIAQLWLEEPDITKASDTVTNATTLYVKGAPSEGTNNYAVWVDAGDARFDAGVLVQDDQLLNLGADKDIAILHKSGSYSADATLSGVIEGTPQTPALAANSLIISNITDDGDILLAVSDGGHSRGLLHLDGDVAQLKMYDPSGNEVLSSSGGGIDINAAQASTGDLAINSASTSDWVLFDVSAEDILFAAATVVAASASAHDAAGYAIEINAGSTTAGTTNNIAGGSLTLRAGQGKGSGAGGDIIFQTANAGSSGSSLNALATALTLSDDLSATFTGKVGIGAAPSEELHVYGSTNGAIQAWIQNANTGTSAYSEVIVGQAAANALKLGMAHNYTGATEWNNCWIFADNKDLALKSDQVIDFYTGGTGTSDKRMSISNDGTVITFSQATELTTTTGNITLDPVAGAYISIGDGGNEGGRLDCAGLRLNGGSFVKATGGTPIGIQVAEAALTTGSLGSMVAPYQNTSAGAFVDGTGGNLNGSFGFNRDSDDGTTTLEARVEGSWVSVALSGYEIQGNTSGGITGWWHENQIIGDERVNETICIVCGEQMVPEDTVSMYANYKRSTESGENLHAVFGHSHLERDVVIKGLLSRIEQLEAAIA